MVVEKKVEMIVRTDDGKPLQIGNYVAYSTIYGDCHCGEYNGINKRGCLEFISLIDKNDVTSIYAKSIKSIKRIAIDILE